MTAPFPFLKEREQSKPNIHQLEISLTYHNADGALDGAGKLAFRTAGFGIYLPYFMRDCDESLR